VCVGVCVCVCVCVCALSNEVNTLCSQKFSMCKSYVHVSLMWKKEIVVPHIMNYHNLSSWNLKLWVKKKGGGGGKTCAQYRKVWAKATWYKDTIR
jgi:hypothetical protein